MTPRVAVDVGGTFTDVVLVTDDNRLLTAKVPSTADQSEGVIEGLLKACTAGEVDPADIEEFTHAMTVSVNALLERAGARTALVTTEGFRDVLEIGRQDRPALYDLSAEKPPPLVPRSRRFELAERTGVNGVETPVDEAEVRDLAERLREADVESVAVALLHAYRSPENERRVADVLREELAVPVSASHEVLSEFREYERTATTAVDAYVTPTIDDYLGRLAERAAARDVPQPRIMQSNGGVAAAERVRSHAVTTLLSGPAAGVIGAERAARSLVAEADLDGLVTIDMGGTSTDVSVVQDGEAERTTDTTIGGVPVRVPMVDVHTIGSGGGSIAWVDEGGALRVGPRSAGADPGPACYGRGGTEPTVTDASVVLGYIGEGTALGGELALDVAAAETALEELAAEAGFDSARAAARGVYRVATAKMTQAIREVTVERGYDPRAFGLVAFGGAGPMHAAAIAANLDVETVAVPLSGGVLSAYGLLAADERQDRVRTHLRPLSATDPAIVDDVLVDLTASARSALVGEDVTIERAADCRYDGQSFELTVAVDEAFDPATVRERFHRAHEQAYGYRMDAAVELVNLRATVESPREVSDPTHAGGEADPETRVAHFGDREHETPVFERAAVAARRTVAGPAVFEQAESTTVVPPGWTAAVRTEGTLVLTAEGSP
jgi:N-methylhydantoinase A